jgi:hypothetical protein
MDELKQVLEAWRQGQKVNGIKAPALSTIIELWDIAYSGERETINSNAVYVLNKCGIETRERGIGWVVV